MKPEESKTGEEWAGAAGFDLPDNRRTAPRVGRPPVDLSGLWGEVVDISLTGLCVAAVEPLKIGSRLDLVLTDTRSQEQRWLVAEVMWSGRYRTGLKWVDLTDSDSEWLVERFAAWLNAYREALRALQVQLQDVDPVTTP